MPSIVRLMARLAHDYNYDLVKVSQNMKNKGIFEIDLNEREVYQNMIEMHLGQLKSLYDHVQSDQRSKGSLQIF